MSNGTIITPLIPDGNIEGNCQTPNDTYTPSDSPEKQMKEDPKPNNKNCCKKINCLEIIFLILCLINISSKLTSIIIKFMYIIPVFIILNVLIFFASLIFFFFL